MPTLLGRFEAKYIGEPNSGCWLWTGAWSERTGYGFIQNGEGKMDQAHRVSHRLFKGPIPEGLEIDHLCRVRCCVNPDHLEAVTRKVNIQRGMAGVVAAQRQLSKAHCKAGHPYSEENTIRGAGREGRGSRTCRACMRTMELERQKNHRLIREARPPKPMKTHFACGHAYTDSNMVRRKGRSGTDCSTCNRLRAARNR